MKNGRHMLLTGSICLLVGCAHSRLSAVSGRPGEEPSTPSWEVTYLVELRGECVLDDTVQPSGVAIKIADSGSLSFFDKPKPIEIDSVLRRVRENLRKQAGAGCGERATGSGCKFRETGCTLNYELICTNDVVCGSGREPGSRP
jgi:hypothetical protein